MALNNPIHRIFCRIREKNQYVTVTKNTDAFVMFNSGNFKFKGRLLFLVGLPVKFTGKN
jgi:hypothetical protein